jgi:hypothetical protein
VAGCGGGTSSPREELSNFVADYVDENRGNCCELGMHVRSSHITFARSDPRWAAVELVITVDGEAGTEPNFLLARKVDSNWTVIGFGKGSLGCHVPAKVRAELAAHAPEGALDCSTRG